LQLCTIHCQRHRRLIEPLVNVGIHRARNHFDLLHELRGDLIIDAQIGARDLYIDRGRQPEIENLRHHIRGLEEEFHAGEPPRQFAPHLFYVALRRAVSRIERDLDLAVMAAEGPGIAISLVDAADRHAQVVENRAELGGRHEGAKDAFHLVRHPRRLFDARARGQAHVQANLAAVHTGEKVAAQNERQTARQRANPRKVPANRRRRSSTAARMTE
jgi:hypothetical protein